jgi:hypothetical protein
MAAFQLHDVRGPANSGLVPAPNARFACGSMVLLLFFFKKIHVVNFFEKRSGFFHPAGG